MHAVPCNPEDVGDLTRGRIPVVDDDLRKKLGHVTWYVYLAMEELAGKTGPARGRVTALRRTVSREASRQARLHGHDPVAVITPRQVKRAQERLSKAGLVLTKHGRTLLVVPHTRRDGAMLGVVKSPEQVCVRTLTGIRAEGTKARVILVTPETRAWLQTHNFRGGVQNPLGYNNMTGKKAAHKAQQESYVKARIGATEGARTGATGLEAGPQVSAQHQGGLESGPQRGARIGATEGLVTCKIVTVPSSLLRKEETAPVGAAPFEIRNIPGGGIAFGNSTHTPRPFRPGHDGVPPFPGPTVVPLALEPSPPLLRDDQDEFRQALVLLKAYRGALRSRYGSKANFHVPGDLAKYKGLDKLIAAAKHMHEAEIAPAAWAAFSVDVWLQYNPRPPSDAARAKATPSGANAWPKKRQRRPKLKVPPLSWVFGLKRLEEREGWFSREIGSYDGQRSVFGPAAQELGRRYAAMRMELAWSKDIKPVVDKWFPDGLYDRLVRKAREESAKKQAELREEVKRGAWMVGW